MKIEYTTFEAARINGVNEATIRKQCADGRMVGAYRQTVRKRLIWRIPASALFDPYPPEREEPGERISHHLST